MTATSAGEPGVVVLGAGPAGATTALALRRAGVGVTIVDSVRQPAIRVGESVPPAVGAALGELGVRITGHRESLGTTSAWGGTALRYRDYLFDGRGPGWHLDRHRFDRELLGAAISAGARVVRDRFVRPGPCFVVDATGRRAAFAVSQGARRHRIDRLLGVVAVMASVGGINHTLIESFEHGWWYAAPLPSGRLLVALLSDADIVRHHRWQEPARWLGQLRRTRHLATVDTMPELTIRAANSQVLTPSHGAGWLAVGDAAMALDPLSSAGILAAIRSGTEAAEAIVSGRLDGYDERVRQRFATFLGQRRFFYGQEQRWETPFWTRRR